MQNDETGDQAVSIRLEFIPKTKGTLLFIEHLDQAAVLYKQDDGVMVHYGAGMDAVTVTAIVLTSKAVLKSLEILSKAWTTYMENRSMDVTVNPATGETHFKISNPKDLDQVVKAILKLQKSGASKPPTRSLPEDKPS